MYICRVKGERREYVYVRECERRDASNRRGERK